MSSKSFISNMEFKHLSFFAPPTSLQESNVPPSLLYGPCASAWTTSWTWLLWDHVTQSPVWAAAAFPALLTRRSLHSCIPRCRRVGYKTRTLTPRNYITLQLWFRLTEGLHICATRTPKHCCCVKVT